MRKILCLLAFVIVLSSCVSQSITEDPKITYTLGNISLLNVSEHQLNGDLKITTDKDNYKLSDSIDYSIINNTNIKYYITQY